MEHHGSRSRWKGGLSPDGRQEMDSMKGTRGQIITFKGTPIVTYIYLLKL
jgi:hypothetical protein